MRELRTRYYKNDYHFPTGNKVIPDNCLSLTNSNPPSRPDRVQAVQATDGFIM